MTFLRSSPLLTAFGYILILVLSLLSFAPFMIFPLKGWNHQADSQDQEALKIRI